MLNIMKNTKYLKPIYLFILAILFATSGCEKWTDPDINIDPDVPSDVPARLILPTIQANMAYDIGGNDLVRPTNMWMHYFNGYARQSLTQGRYSYTPADVNNLWNSLYATVLMDLKQMKEKAIEGESNHIEGVADVLTALTLMTVVDIWDNVPWTEAFQGGANLSPMPDSQESLYVAIIAMLDNAIAKLKETRTGTAIGGDMIFGNDATKWVNAAYTIKARAILVQSGRNSNAYSQVVAVLNEGGIKSNADNMSFGFSDPQGAGHPLYQFMLERGDITMGKTFIDMLLDINDPRITTYATKNDEGDYVGGVIGSEQAELISVPGVYAADDEAKVYFATFAETSFMKAEALLATDAAAAYAAYLDGVLASVQQAGIDVADLDALEEDYNAFFTAVTDGGANGLTLEKIIKQKYIALYNTALAYNDFRRTGFPLEITVAANANLAEIPSRFPYSQGEITYNSNINTVPLTQKVWWDVE
jgi:hypothetical protein